MYTIKRIIREILIRACNCKKLKVAIIFNKIEFSINSVFNKITLDIFWGIDAVGIRHSLVVFPYFIRSLLSINFMTYISTAFFIIYLNYRIFINIISVTKSFITFQNTGKLLSYIWNMQFDKVRIMVTIALLTIAVIYIINNIRFRRYSEYEQFEISLKELEKEKIKKVVIYQEEILDILNELYDIVNSNLEPINWIFLDSKKNYYNYIET